MYLTLNLDDIGASQNYILEFFERTYGLSNCSCWYKKEDGKLYYIHHTGLGRCEECAVELDEEIRKAYEIYKQLLELFSSKE